MADSELFNYCEKLMKSISKEELPECKTIIDFVDCSCKIVEEFKYRFPAIKIPSMRKKEVAILLYAPLLDKYVGFKLIDDVLAEEIREYVLPKDIGRMIDSVINGWNSGGNARVNFIGRLLMCGYLCIKVDDGVRPFKNVTILPNI